ncbi:MAG: glycosyltransferase [Vampirovibrionales bacterium]|nr:glycosyltransferase [Vampirovibrionales bacterium]
MTFTSLRSKFKPVLALILLLFVALILTQGHVFAEVDGSLAGKSISEIATMYHGQLSRPLFPAFSLGLPLGVQAFISIGLILVLLIIGTAFPKARRAVMVLTSLCILRHLVWRAVHTIDLSNPVLAIPSIVLFVAECLAAFTLVIGYIQIWTLSEHKKPAPLPERDAELPGVDVLVCTYNEPVAVLYRTLIGCRAIDYPNMNVYLCDDGNRLEMKQLAEQLGVRYIARADNRHAKAGNLNNALTKTKNPLVVVFDADHVPVKSFLKETVGFFAEKKLAFVQTPQHFYTLDPFQRNLIASKAVNNEQDLFFHVIEPGNDAHKATFFAGSGAVFRREALESVGGFAVETVTEDVHTGLRLHAKGWESLYYNKDLSAGLAQDSFVDYVNQRLRWARGMVQIFFHDHPLFMGGLSAGQRVCYLAGIWHFLSSWPRLIFMVSPLLFLLFGLQTINAGFVEVLVYYAPSFLALFLGYSTITQGLRQSFWSELYETATSVYFAFTNLATFVYPNRSKFKVTPKEGYTGRLYFNWQIVLPQLIIAALTVVGIGMAVIRMIYTPEYAGGIYTNLFWAAYNLVLLIGAVYVAQERPQYRLTPRISREIPCELRLLDGTIAVGHVTDVSESGVAMRFPAPIPVAGTMALKILDWEIERTSTYNVQAIRSVVDETGTHLLGCRVVNRSEEQHQALVEHMFSAPSTWADDHNETEPVGAFGNLVQTPFRVLKRHEKALRRRVPRFTVQMPCTLTLEDAPNHSHISGMIEEISETGLSALLPFNKAVAQGQSYPLLIEWPDGKSSQIQAQVARIQRAANGQSRVGFNFVGLNKEDRLTLIDNLFQAHDGLVRVAPTMARMVPCSVYLADSGRLVRGMTQEISEMGLRALFNEPLPAQESVTVTLHWDEADAAQEPMTLEAKVMTSEPLSISGSIDQSQAGHSCVLFFNQLTLAAMEQLSRSLHQPQELYALEA